MLKFADGWELERDRKLLKRLNFLVAFYLGMCCCPLLQHKASAWTEQEDPPCLSPLVLGNEVYS